MFTRDYRVESRKKSGPRYAWILPAVVGLILVALAAIYGPRLYYRVTGDAILRIQNRIAQLEERIAKNEGSVEELLSLVDDIRRLVDIQRRNKPADAEALYYEGLLDFYEFLLRTPLDGATLVQLTGRGYLPLQIEGEDLKPLNIADHSRRMAAAMRRALALDPEFDRAPEAHLVILYGDLFHTGRTDPHLLTLLAAIPADKLEPGLSPYRDWIGLGLYALSGKKTELAALMTQIAAPPAEGAPPLPRLALDEPARNLILCHGYFNAKDYLQALMLARSVKTQIAASAAQQSEAARMEGEIFLVQRGPLAAIFFFEEALRLAGGADPFLNERLDQLQTPAE
jgi:hypothetical protein